MFNHTHYVPILRWKRGERVALENLRAQHRRRMTPLLEIISKDFLPNRKGIARPPDRVLAQKAVEISRSWGRERFFLDLGLLDPRLRAAKGIHPLEVLGVYARSRRLGLIPVTGLTRSHDYQSAVASLVEKDNRGACIRLTREDIEHPRFQRQLQRLLSHLGVQSKQVDLLVDYEVIDDSSPPIESLCAQVPELRRWRTFTVVSGAFPKDLTGFKVGQHLLSRLDWLAWRDHMLASTKLTRRPSYGDYSTSKFD